MNCTLLFCRVRSGRRGWVVAWLTALCLIMPFSGQAEHKVESVVINRQVYSNVVIQSKTATHLFFNHDQGFAAVKLTDIPTETYRRLTSPSSGGPIAHNSGGQTSGTQTAEALGGETESGQPQPISPRMWGPSMFANQQLPATLLPVLFKMLWLVIVVALVCHLLFSFCFMLICQKAGQPPGMLVWLPWLQFIPLFKAAKMSAWNFILFLLPVINVVVYVAWCFKICQALHKSPWLGLLLLLPVTSLFALLYLAFGGGSTAEDDSPVVKLDFAQTEPE